MEKLRIGFFVDTWFPMIDGVINVVNSYATELSKIADVTVFTCGSKKKDTKTYPFKVVRSTSLVLPFFEYEVPNINPKFEREIKNSNLDLVHIHSPFMIGKVGIQYAKKHHLPLVGTLHSQYYQDFYRYTKNKWLSKQLLKGVVKLFNMCDKNFTVNDRVANIALEYGFNEKPEINNNGTNMEHIEDIKPSFDFFEKEYNIKKEENVFLFVGRINLIKNLKFLIDSLAELKKLGEDFKMLFVGSGTDIEVLQAQIKKLKLTEQVYFLGRVDDDVLKYCYVRAKLFLFPSVYDTNSLVQIEASSQKTPTLFIRGSATSATVTENVNGFMAENDPKKYAERIQEILKDEELYNTVSENAFKDLYITWEDTVSKVYEKYLKIIEDKKESNKREKEKVEAIKKQKRQQQLEKQKKERQKKIAENKLKLLKQKELKKKQLQRQKEKNREKAKKMALRLKEKMLAKEIKKEKSKE